MRDGRREPDRFGFGNEISDGEDETALADNDAIEVLGGTTSLLLLAVFAMVNVAVLVLRRDSPSTMRAVQRPGEETGNRSSRQPRRHYKTRTPLPVIGCVASLYLVTPLSGRPGQQYLLAAILIGSGVVLSLATQLFNHRRAHRVLAIDDIAPIGATSS